MTWSVSVHKAEEPGILTVPTLVPSFLLLQSVFLKTLCAVLTGLASLSFLSPAAVQAVCLAQISLHHQNTSVFLVDLIMFLCSFTFIKHSPFVSILFIKKKKKFIGYLCNIVKYYTYSVLKSYIRPAKKGMPWSCGTYIIILQVQHTGHIISQLPLTLNKKRYIHI